MISLWFILSWALASAGRNAGGRTNVGEWTDTTWTDNPFMARLDVHKDDYSFICGGSIIATNEWNGKGVILTAAHCVYGADNVNIWVGCTDTMCSDRIATGFNDDHYVVHPDYTEDLSTTDVRWCNNDVALVFLRKAITVEGATSISLHKDLNVLSNDDAISVYGYYGSCEGSTAGCVGGSDTDTLETAAINYMPSNECDDIYGRHVTGPHDFCVKDDVRSDGLQGVCMGDSGSPAIYDGKQIGLNSWGPGDCDPQYPTVLTSVPFYYDWIAEQCPECVEGDSEDEDDGEYGLCEGVQARYDRMCSKKMNEAACSNVRRGTVCEWVTHNVADKLGAEVIESDATVIESDTENDEEFQSEGEPPETVAGKASVFDMEKVVSFGHDMVHKQGIANLSISPLDVILLIAFAMTMFAISLQLCSCYKRWKERRGYLEVAASVEDYEEGKRGFKV